MKGINSNSNRRLYTLTTFILCNLPTLFNKQTELLVSSTEFISEFVAGGISYTQNVRCDVDASS